MFGVGSTVKNPRGFGTVSSRSNLTLHSSSPTEMSQLPHRSLDQVLILPQHQSKWGENNVYWIG